MAEIDEYLALIERERNRRPAEAMLADEIEALRSIVRELSVRGPGVDEWTDDEAEVIRRAFGNQEEYDRG